MTKAVRKKVSTKSKSLNKFEALENLAPTISESFKSLGTKVSCSLCNGRTLYFDILNTGEVICPVCTHKKGYLPDAEVVCFLESFDPRDPDIFNIALKVAEFEKLKPETVSNPENFVESVLPTEIREAIAEMALKNQTGLNEVIVAGLAYFVSVYRSKD